VADRIMTGWPAAGRAAGGLTAARRAAGLAARAFAARWRLPVPLRADGGRCATGGLSGAGTDCAGRAPDAAVGGAGFCGAEGGVPVPGAAWGREGAGVGAAGTASGPASAPGRPAGDPVADGAAGGGAGGAVTGGAAAACGAVAEAAGCRYDLAEPAAGTKLAGLRASPSTGGGPAGAIGSAGRTSLAAVSASSPGAGTEPERRLACVSGSGSRGRRSAGGA
jgi:hypothetical protein